MGALVQQLGATARWTSDARSRRCWACDACRGGHRLETRAEGGCDAERVGSLGGRGREPLHAGTWVNDLGSSNGTLLNGAPVRSERLREGDVLVEFSGQPVSSIDALHKLLTSERIGAKSQLTIIRGSEKLGLQITPAESAT